MKITTTVSAPNRDEKKTETNVVERIVWVKFACGPPFDVEYSAISYQNGKYSSSIK